MKCVMITGANRGLGKALLDTFHDAGWFVVATAQPADVAARILALYTAGTLRESNGRFLNTDGSEHPW